MNITVKAPQGGEYDVDIQKTKQKYITWRRLQWVIGPVSLIVLLVWVSWNEPEDSSVFSLAGVKGFFYWVFLTWQGWVSVFLSGLSLFYDGWLPSSTKVHFECPFPLCRTQIFVTEPWECPHCRDDKKNVPFLPRTFFDKCKHGHIPQSYQCPTCVKEGREGIFELIPGGRKDKFAKRWIPPQVPPPPQAPPPRQEYIPRDRFY